MVASSLKFMCSYGGRILPRYPDGKLRYNGGETRILSVDRPITFQELVIKLEEMYGGPVNLRCQLPDEDLDALISIKSDEDLTNMIEEYDRMPPSSPSPMKIRAFLSAVKPQKKVSPATSSASSSPDATSPRSPFCPCKLPPRRNVSRPPVYPVLGGKAAGKMPRQQCGHVYVIHNGNHWQ